MSRGLKVHAPLKQENSNEKPFNPRAVSFHVAVRKLGASANFSTIQPKATRQRAARALAV
jgi:hypothetical protein